LLYKKYFNSAAQALDYFNTARSRDGENVILPSQIRYVHYMYFLSFENHFSTFRDPRKILLNTISITPIIPFEKDGNYVSLVKISQLTNEGGNLIKELSYTQNIVKDGKIDLIVDTLLQGDIIIKFYHKSKNPKHFSRVLSILHDPLTRIKVATKFPFLPLFRVSFHTSFITEEWNLSASELDSVYAGPVITNKYIPVNIKVRFNFNFDEISHKTGIPPVSPNVDILGEEDKITELTNNFTKTENFIDTTIFFTKTENFNDTNMSEENILNFDTPDNPLINTNFINNSVNNGNEFNNVKTNGKEFYYQDPFEYYRNHDPMNPFSLIDSKINKIEEKEFYINNESKTNGQDSQRTNTETTSNEKKFQDLFKKETKTTSYVDTVGDWYPNPINPIYRYFIN